MKTEVRKANGLDKYCPVFFHEEKKKVSDLMNALADLEESMPVGWQWKPSRIGAKLWVRYGNFVPVKKAFTDAFDHSDYKVMVWEFSKEASKEESEGSIIGLELHGWGADPNPSDMNEIIGIETVGELKQMLRQVSEDAYLLAPSENFELRGNLERELTLHCQKDLTGQEWLLLAADDCAARGLPY